MSIEDKLREILESNNGGSYWDTKTAIKEIIHLFNKQYPLLTLNSKNNCVETLKTGQEWFTAFERELDKLSVTPASELWHGTPLIEAAKRASGVDK